MYQIPPANVRVTPAYAERSLDTAKITNGDLEAVADQPAYPLLEGLLRIKGSALQPTYTNADVASLFSVSVRTIQSRVADGRLPSRRLLGRARFLPIDLEAFLRESKSHQDV
jgi:Helix-turn-helix domain